MSSEMHPTSSDKSKAIAVIPIIKNEFNFFVETILKEEQENGQARPSTSTSFPNHKASSIPKVKTKKVVRFTIGDETKLEIRRGNNLFKEFLMSPSKTHRNTAKKLSPRKQNQKPTDGIDALTKKIDSLQLDSDMDQNIHNGSPSQDAHSQDSSESAMHTDD